jgi:hypothetical protein
VVGRCSNPICEVSPECCPDRFDGEWGRRGNLRSETRGCIQQVIERHKFVGKPDLHCLIASNAATCVQQPCCHLLANQCWQCDREAEPMMESELREVGTEPGLGGDDSKISSEAEPQPTADRGPLHRRLALKRAILVGDGWHGAFLTPEQTERRVAKLRAERPEAEFTISMRTRWDPLLDNHDTILAELDHYLAIGVDHFVPEPRQRTLDDYLRSTEMQAELFRRAGFEMAT